MRKKLLIVLLVIATAICCVFGLAACDSEDTEGGKTKHTHSYTESVIDPTCINRGYTLRTCECGDKHKNNYKPALGHSFENYISDENATCTKDGTKTAKCERCDETDTIEDKESALGHEIENHSAKEVTCTGIGWNAYETCSRCDYTTYSKISALGHNYVNHVCSRCDDKYFTKGLEYSEIEENGEVVAYSVKGIGTATDIDIVIPSVCNDKPVTEIGNDAFSDYYLASITIPDSVESIGRYAFSGCLGLTKIIIPDSVKLIGASAFEACFNLTSVTIGNGVTSIGFNTFNKCVSLTGITIPDSVKIIGLYAFYQCLKLNEIIIPDSVESIGNYAFYMCIELTSVTIPDSVESIGNYAFAECDNLMRVTIGNGTTSIGDWAFFGCNSLAELTIPDSVKTIGSSAFYRCSGLASVTIGNSVEHIGEEAFLFCSSLVEVFNKSELNISAGSSENGYVAFYAKNVYTQEGDSKITIDQDGFIIYDNSLLVGYNGSKTNIVIPDNVTEIGDNLFYNSPWITGVTIPESVTKIGRWAFEYCPNLSSITVAEENSVYHSEGNCLIETATKTLILGCNRSVIPTDGSVTSIGDFAFNGCGGLKSIIIPDSIESIGYYAFSGCHGLKSVKTGNGVKTIGAHAFGACSNLTSITINNGVISIGANVIYNCNKLTDIYFNGTKAQWNNIEKANGWNSDTGYYTIHYIDEI